jgi:hypothetical protein
VDVVGKESKEEVRIPGALRSAIEGSNWELGADVEGVEAVELRAVLASGTERLRKDIVRRCLWLKYPSRILVLEFGMWRRPSEFRHQHQLSISPPPFSLTFTTLQYPIPQGPVASPHPSRLPPTQLQP